MKTVAEKAPREDRTAPSADHRLQIDSGRGMSMASPDAARLGKLQDMANRSPQVAQTARYQAMANNRTGMPDSLKAGVESLSGQSMDDVKVHHNSSKPAQLQALAYTQGTDIHVAPGQEKHLPHEAWHVVQQKEGRVQPTIQAKDVAVNDSPVLENEADVMGSRAKTLGDQVVSRAGDAGAETPSPVVQAKQARSTPVVQRLLNKDEHEGLDEDFQETAAGFHQLARYYDEGNVLALQAIVNHYETQEPAGVKMVLKQKAMLYLKQFEWKSSDEEDSESSEDRILLADSSNELQENFNPAKTGAAMKQIVKLTTEKKEDPLAEIALHLSTLPDRSSKEDALFIASTDSLSHVNPESPALEKLESRPIVKKQSTMRNTMNFLVKKASSLGKAIAPDPAADPSKLYAEAVLHGLGALALQSLAVLAVVTGPLALVLQISAGVHLVIAVSKALRASLMKTGVAAADDLGKMVSFEAAMAGFATVLGLTTAIIVASPVLIIGAALGLVAAFIKFARGILVAKGWTAKNPKLTGWLVGIEAVLGFFSSIAGIVSNFAEGAMVAVKLAKAVISSIGGGLRSIIKGLRGHASTKKDPK